MSSLVTGQQNSDSDKYTDNKVRVRKGLVSAINSAVQF